MVKPSTHIQDAKIVAAALRVAGAAGWDKTTVDAVANAAKLTPALLKKRFAAPVDLVPLIAEQIDREAFAAAGKSTGTPHDILFDLLMARFDALQKNRKAVLSMEMSARQDRKLAGALACATLDGIYRLIDAAKFDTPLRPILASGLGMVYGFAFFAWRRDDSRDLAKTMAALDRALRWAGKAAALIQHS